jgi:hypothetical protein
VNLIELKDSRLCLRNEQGVIAESPGWANIAGKEPVFGDAARRMARLHPRQSFNQHWQQLSLDPLLIKTKLVRHHADLAYSQLQLLLQGVAADTPTLVAAPANYTRAQLGVLLGVLKQTGVAVQGLADHSLLQAASTGSPDCIVLDLQLHQAVLIAFIQQDGVLTKVKVAQVPGAGLVALQDAWISAITDAFLQQSRFDPTHSAETEQYIADHLDTWLAASAAQGELLLDINLKGTSYQARVTHDQFVQRSKALFARIARELPALRSESSTLHVHTAQLALPGLAAAFAGITAIADDAALQVALHHRAALLRPGEALGFLTRLPLSVDTAATATAPIRQPTHLLYRHQAVALPQGKLAFGTPPAALACERVLSVPGLAGALVLQRTLRGVSVESHGIAAASCNGVPLQSGLTLKLGDSIVIDNHDAPLQLILVE